MSNLNDRATAARHPVPLLEALESPADRRTMAVAMALRVACCSRKAPTLSATRPSGLRTRPQPTPASSAGSASSEGAKGDRLHQRPHQGLILLQSCAPSTCGAYGVARRGISLRRVLLISHVHVARFLQTKRNFVNKTSQTNHVPKWREQDARSRACRRCRRASSWVLTASQRGARWSC